MPGTVKPTGRGASAPNRPTGKRGSAKKVTKKKVSAGPKSKRKYIRNLHHGAGGARLGLADGSELQLAPRGQVGDMVLIGEEQQEDPLYQRNKDFLFEELTVEQGLEVIDKQSINAQAFRSSPLEHITNENGEAYTRPVNVTQTFESQGQVVGAIAPAGEGISSQNTGNIQRQTQEAVAQMGQPPTVQNVMGPQQIAVPGSAFNPDIMPAGLSTQQAEQFLQTPREHRAQLVEVWANEATENLVNQLRG